MKSGWLAAVLAVLMLSGCNGCKGNKSRTKPDVSGVKAELHFQRFDRDLFAFANTNFAEHRQAMLDKYGSFYNFYLSEFVIGPRPAGDTTNIEEQAIAKFIGDGYIRRIQDSIDHYYSDISDVQGEMTQAFKYFKYYFPEIATPKVITVNSGFSIGAFTYENDVLGIGLDLYLGGNNPDYDSAGIYRYLQHKMSRAYIPRNSMEVLYNFYFGTGEEKQHTLAEAMVEKGKKMYLLSYVFPDAPDSLIVGFTEAQTQWCEKNEYDIWKFLNDKDLLYKSDYMNQKRYLDDAPTTQGMPPESPGSIGNWIGLQIVRQFMKESGSHISLHDMILKYDSKTIFEKSKYRPAKAVI